MRLAASLALVLGTAVFLTGLLGGAAPFAQISHRRAYGVSRLSVALFGGAAGAGGGLYLASS